MQLATALGLARAGIFIPYRHTAGIEPIDYPFVHSLLERARPQLIEHLERIESHAEAFAAFGGAPPAPRFEQDWFPRLDMACAYAMVRAARPSRIVEIGSGHSTRVMARAYRDEGAAVDIACIDPAPRADLSGLGVRHLRCLLQEADPGVLEALGAGDILFIDSSHVAVPGSDVDVLLNQVLPQLAGGCIVHVHDVFLPDPYPKAWRWRGYNEQLLLASLLQGGAYEILFASHHVATSPDLMAVAPVVARLPLLPGALETSFWLRKRVAPAD